MENRAITFGERAVAGTMTSVVMLVMLICLPIAVMFIAPKFVMHKGAFILLYGKFHIYAVPLLIAAFMAGAVLGTERVTDLFGHLWGTARPRRERVTAALWLGLIGIAFSSYMIFGR